MKKNKFMCTVTAIATVCISNYSIAQNAGGFHVAKTFHIASAGGWDYIAVGPGNNRLYVSHGTQVNIIDEKTGDSVGVIPNTTGVHGIAFVPSLAKGYTSNGRLNNITVFDLKTNQVLGQIATGQNPRQLLANQRVMIRNVTGALHLVNAQLQGCQRRISQRQNVSSRLRLHVAAGRQRQHLLLGIGN